MRNQSRITIRTYKQSIQEAIEKAWQGLRISRRRSTPSGCLPDHSCVTFINIHRDIQITCPPLTHLDAASTVDVPCLLLPSTPPAAGKYICAAEVYRTHNTTRKAACLAMTAVAMRCRALRKEKALEDSTPIHDDH